MEISASVCIPAKEISFKITYSQYKNALLDDRKILVTAVCETRQGASLLLEKDIVLQDPLLTIEVKSQSLLCLYVSCTVSNLQGAIEFLCFPASRLDLHTHKGKQRSVRSLLCYIA